MANAGAPMNARAHLPHTDDAPRDLRTEGGGGKLYPIDPAAWEHFKRVMAEQQQSQPRRPQRKPTGIKRGGNGRLDADLQRKVDELRERAAQKAAEKPAEENIMKPKMTNDEVLAAHRRYAVEGLSLRQAAESTSMSEPGLTGRFKRMGLPTRNRNGEWDAGDRERVCSLHGVSPADLGPADYGRAAERAAKAPAQRKPSVRAQTSEPQPQPEPTAVVPVRETAMPVATNGNGHGAIGDLAVVNEQLAALQALLSQAEAKSVHIRGRIRVELTAEVEL